VSRPIKKISVSPAARQALEEGQKKGKTHVYRKRCQIVLLKLEGYNSKEIGKIVGSCEMSVNNWITRFESAGLAGLQTQAGQGRKPIFQEADISVVREAVQQERQRLSQAQKIIEENLGKRMSYSTLTRFLKVITAVTNE
jgi:transposase